MSGLLSAKPKLKRDENETIKKRSREKKNKEKPKQMTPEEYAQMLMDKVNSGAHGIGHKKYVKFLAGKNLFYTGGDMHHATERTRGRMEIIVRYGGNLLPKYDESVVTHIVTDAQIRPTLRALGLKNLDDIPDHIPTVRWSWIVSAIGRTPSAAKGSVNVRMDEVWLHAAFSKRIDAGIPRVRSKTSLKGKAVEDSDMNKNPVQDDGSDSDGNIEEPLGAGVQPSAPLFGLPATSHDQRPSFKQTTPPQQSTTDSQDPLAEYYPKAKAELDSEWSRHVDAEGSDLASDYEPIDTPLPKRGWTCDNKDTMKQSCANQDIIDKLQELMELHKSRPGEEDRWRVYSYSKCIRALRHYPRRIKSFTEACSIRGVGEKTALKVMEIIKTGQLRRIEYENTDDIKVTRLFQGIYGAGVYQVCSCTKAELIRCSGQSTAFKWYAAGCRTLDDLLAGKGGIKLTEQQEIGIKFYDDINSRMPREEARAIFNSIKLIALRIDSKLVVEIMGSYRRGKSDCGDIDILITRPTDDGKTHAGIEHDPHPFHNALRKVPGVLRQLLAELHSARILTEDLALPEDPNDLEATYRGLCCLPGVYSKRRRIDFLMVPWCSRGAALLYFTGDDIFNRAIRMKANVMGYSLNQRGLFAGVVRDPHDRRVKTNPGTLIAAETEEEIFKILAVPWQEPHERVRG
ncbi:hypothetical protein AMATHDRAFT_145957 [Amanita thiersii Skay4041]|uniref:DNA polymerase n=1 Tax=Amanita thiersii Skay4041 TaxID=703135 RepID=A0A2A9NHL5_9AGAR|nr:hypothetical protein AMATHDRAFT_145957 [Amanita thiersii Skay4041]